MYPSAFKNEYKQMIQNELITCAEQKQKQIQIQMPEKFTRHLENKRDLLGQNKNVCKQLDFMSKRSDVKLSRQRPHLFIYF